MKFCHVYFVIFILGLNSCSDQPEFIMPTSIDVEFNEKATSDIDTAINKFNQADAEVHTFNSENPIFVDAYVISSDEAGNFYKTLVVQDKPKNPLNGLEIKVDFRSYYTKYNLGRRLLLRLSGLSIEKKNEKYILGYLSGNSVGDIPENLLDHFIIRSFETVEIIPKQIGLEDVSPDLINTYIEINKLQFSKTELGKSFASEAVDKYNGERIFEQCENLSRGLLFTSSYADFGSHLLPESRFQLRAVLTSDSYTGDLTFVLNDPDNIVTLDNERCDPAIFECSSDFKNTIEDEIFYENFEGLASSRDIEKIGWENINVNYGNGRFKKRSSNENTFLQISAYDSNEFVMEVWLISPLIDLSRSENEFLTFDTRATFEEGMLLTCWFSTNYTNNIREANWQQLDVDISVGSRDGSNDIFLNSGKVKLNCLEGKIRLALRYLGADPGASTTYDVDNVLILGDDMGN